jgi:hypothetical protein
LARNHSAISIFLPFWKQMLMRYTITEANTAFKPAFLQWIFLQHADVEKVLYFDPDVWITGSIDRLWSILDDNDVVFTPHILAPFPRDGRMPDEIVILRAGTFNLGFVGMRRSNGTAGLLAWWHQRLITGAIVDVDKGYHFDQKWMDLVPSYMSSVHVLRDRAYNVAYWNLHERGQHIRARHLGNDSHVVFTDTGDEIAFMHFSGFDTKTPGVLSRHQNRFTLATDFPALVPIFAHFAQRLESFGVRDSQDWPYAYDFFHDGQAIRLEHRMLFRWLTREELLRTAFADPFDGYFVQYLAESPRKDGTLPRLLNRIVESRKDLQDAFPRKNGRKYLPSQVQQLRDWFKRVGARELSLPADLFD